MLDDVASSMCQGLPGDEALLAHRREPQLLVCRTPQPRLLQDGARLRRLLLAHLHPETDGQCSLNQRMPF